MQAGLIDMASAGTPDRLDVVRLSYLDSQGVAMFFRLARRAKVNGSTLTIAIRRASYWRVLDITHVGEAITIIDGA
jgi:ABC-type transporter Mla MlaB component